MMIFEIDYLMFLTIVETVKTFYNVVYISMESNRPNVNDANVNDANIQ